MYCISLSDASNCISPERGTRAILKCNHCPISALKLYSGVVVVIGAVPKDRTASRSVTMHLRKRMTVFFSFEVSYWWTCNHQADKNYYRKKKQRKKWVWFSFWPWLMQRISGYTVHLSTNHLPSCLISQAAVAEYSPEIFPEKISPSCRILTFNFLNVPWNTGWVRTV